MYLKYAAIAALSTLTSAAVFATPAVANPGDITPGAGSPGRSHSHRIEVGRKKRSVAAESGWTQTTRDGKVLDSRSIPEDVTPAGVPRAGTRSDFDGDGRDDIAASSDYGVLVSYSSVAHRDQLATEAIEDEPIYFGSSLVSGNFNQDGYDDLAISDPGEIDTNTKGLRAGGIWIFYGGPDGLQIDAVRHINQSTAVVPGASEADDLFGFSLAAGDVTGDGIDDLAVGLPGESLGSAQNTGGVILLLGSGSGIVTAGSQWIDQNTSGVPGSNETGDWFGTSLSIGKINKDAYAELVVGTAFENDGDGHNGSGMLTQFSGSASGASLTGVTSATGEQVTSAVNTSGTSIYELGWRTAVTDTNKDGYGDVIVGDDAATIGGKPAAGAVISIRGSSTGMSATTAKVFSQDTSGVAGATEAKDWFGGAIAVGDATGDGYGDVLIGAPGEDIGSLADAGSVILLRGSSSGLTGTGSQSLDQSSSLVPGSAEADDAFGYTTSLLNLDGKGTREALVGSPGEAVGDDTPDAKSGTVTAFPTTSAGLGTGVTTAGRSLVPAGDPMTGYGWNLSARQG
ncbi:MAG: hypothetical protein QOE51_2628 [Actinoplanes sp.]|jgi:hypothetical protein|nr:hypothetical protein [Actinoplanes sp.]